MIPRMKIREALVTGVGVVNAVSDDFESFVEAMRAGRCGQRPITSFDAGGLRNPRACEAVDFDPRPVYERRDDKRTMERSSELVLAAFDQAVAMAGIDLHEVAPMRGAVAMGSTLGGSVAGFRYYRAVREGRRRPSQLRDHSMHAPGYRLCIESGFLGPNLVFSTACTSSNLALAVACDLVRANKADVVIAGGFDTMSQVSCSGFSVMRNVTPGVCRPFDRNRDGLILGEGSAVLIVEADDFAARRGARRPGDDPRPRDRLRRLQHDRAGPDGGRAGRLHEGGDRHGRRDPPATWTSSAPTERARCSTTGPRPRPCARCSARVARTSPARRSSRCSATPSAPRGR